MLPCLLATLAFVHGQLGDGLAQTPEPPPDTQTVLAAWEQIGLNANPEAAAFIEQRLATQTPGRDYWHEVFSRFDLPFTANHEAFLTYLLGASGRFDAALPLAAAATGEALPMGPWNFPEGNMPGRVWPDGGAALLRWTTTFLSNIPSGPARTAVRESFGAALESNPLAFGPYFEGENMARLGASAMQLVLLLASLAEQEELPVWVELPESMTAIYAETGVLLWDGGALSASQQRSLESFYGVFPPSAHQIGLLVASEVLGISATSLNNDVPPFAQDLELISLNALFNDVAPETGIAGAAPRFSVAAAVQLARALAYRARFDRPQVNVRFEQIRSRAGQTAEAYPLLRVPSSAEGLMADTMRAWSIDAAGQLERAIAQAEDGYYTVLEAFLALADLLSAGDNVAPALATSIVGEVSTTEAALQRTSYQGVSMVTGITIGDISVAGDLDNRGYIVEITTP